jgi:hypothetical protein
MRFKISDTELNQTIFSAWGRKKLMGLVLGPLLFLTYTNDLPKTVNDKTALILFADDTCIIVKRYNSKDFQNNMVTAFDCVCEWFKVNLLSTDVYTTNYVQFKT